jgi:protein-S-isoprenylcysteine O-methyltransferase Ste14
MGVPLFLRGALDDDALTVVAIALAAMDALVSVAPEEERLLDLHQGFTFGRRVPPLCPVIDPSRPTADEAEGGEAGDPPQVQDIENCQRDLVDGLLKMDLLPRLCVLLSHSGGYDDEALQRILRITIRVARHSLSSATAVVDCTGLIAVVFQLFINPGALLPPAGSAGSAGPGPAPPASGTASSAARARRMCTPLALKLIRVLASTGRSIAAKVTESGRMGMISAFMLDTLTAFDPPARAVIRAEAYAVLRCTLELDSHGGSFVSLYQHLVQRAGHLARLVAYDNSEWAEAVQLIRLLEAAVQSALTHSGSGASAPASSAAASAERLNWEHVEHLLLPVLELIKGAAAVAEAALRRGEAGAANPAALQGAVHVVATGFKFVGIYVEVHRRATPDEIVSVLDRTAATLSEVLDHAGAQSIRQWAWDQVVSVPPPTQQHGTAKTLYRFVRHPTLFAGHAGAIQAPRSTAISYIAGMLWVCLQSATINQSVVDSARHALPQARVAAYMKAAVRLPRLVDRDDTLPYVPPPPSRVACHVLPCGMRVLSWVSRSGVCSGVA